ncbi:hypothetical protein [Jiangella anatolica]|uniref:Neutral/alkaline non-lysosomal ceramidase N-terminal domain-containing protein n=1 Tax=Jiangella anatolica TaxID=2670374 RepID=A0A2W2B4I5_9ACTN|nr:hypothetical protein [Jiangella anatolica]PZF79870.1 hypothetical protein C1I92_28920 [Jiangella anatolica]
MRIGHGEQVFEVRPGEPMGGYADRTHGVGGVLDPLEVHVVTFAAGGRRFALVVADLVCVNADVAGQVRDALRELRIDDCWVAATHTHASPEAGCRPGGGPTPPDVGRRLVEAAVSAAKAAVADERDATLTSVRAEVADLAGRRTAGAADRLAVPVDALVVSAGGRVTGVVTVTPVHPTVLPAGNSDVSADLNGAIRRALRAPGRWAVAATGAAGDISTRHTRRGRSPAELDRLASLVAAALPLPPNQTPAPAPAPSRPGPDTIGPALERRVRLEPRTATELAAATAATADGSADERTRHVFDQGRRIAGELAARGEPYDVDVQAVRLGGVTLVAIPGELFLELGEAIRAGAGLDVIVVGYANGYLGYLPSRGTSPTYETLVSPVRLGSGEQVVDAAVDAARSVTGEEST